MNEHDVRLVLTAVLVCILSSATGFDLLQRARGHSGRAQAFWLLASATVVGVGTWATHFVGILAYTPLDHSGFSVSQTIASAVAGIGIGGAGLALLVHEPQRRWAAPLSGAVVGLGVAALHYLGVMAVASEVRPTFDLNLVVASVSLGVVLSAAATWTFASFDGPPARLLAAFVLTLAILSHHMIGMAGLRVPRTVAALDLVSAQSRPWLAGWIVAGMAAVLLLGLIGLVFDRALVGRSLRDGGRLKALSDAAFEGIVVFEDDIIVECNARFCKLIGRTEDAILGASFRSLVAEVSGRHPLSDALQHPEGGTLQAVLYGEDRIPVEVVVRHLAGDKGVRQTIAAVRDLRERQATEARIRFLAHHDNLTGCANRAFFNLRLEEAIRRASEGQTRIALHYLDLDHFKEVNDTWGHAAGDEVLRTVARRLQSLVQQGDIVGRIGGDEFVIAQIGIGDAEEAAQLAERIVSLIGQPVEVPNGEVSVGVSIGVALFPTDGRTADELVQSADMALYRSKDEGRGGYRTFESDMAGRLRERRAIQADLSQAIRDGGLTLAYQPQVALPSRETIGFEALVRWNHPVRGPIPPSVFIPLAEEAGLIGKLGEWVLRTACREAASWERPLGIAVNLSPCQIMKRDVPELVHEVLLATGLAPHRLELEITEGVLMQDLTRALDTLRRIKALGVRIAMDDFGTGYCSLSYLQSFPFDKIKIDRSFIDNLDSNEQSRTIVRAVLGIGRGFGVSVLAEGVETDAQLAVLAGESCQEVQGYLTGRPGNIASFRNVTDRAPVPDAVVEDEPKAA